MNPQLLQKEREMRDHYTKLLSSVIDIIRQQYKAEWITYGDECLRYFFAKAKQSKTALYIFEIQYEQGRLAQGFPVLATIMQQFYKGLWGEHNTQRSKPSKIPNCVSKCTPTLQKQCLDVTGFQEGSLPMRYLGVPVTASRLSKLECKALVEKNYGNDQAVGHKKHLLRRQSSAP
ncbi:hypothetical protein Cgig2_014496 [Carnegiea gigantea]|uniref:Uncharacterized protein n=1 Tax=Carnegiea gigantea TaxID=171969 RepID=A0A9Q1QA32_9CARY|nr:hypothetical protein Cgig2_014496 [Carnegiea gigantea]